MSTFVWCTDANGDSRRESYSDNGKAGLTNPQWRKRLRGESLHARPLMPCLTCKGPPWGPQYGAQTNCQAQFWPLLSHTQTGLIALQPKGGSGGNGASPQPIPAASAVWLSAPSTAKARTYFFMVSTSRSGGLHVCRCNFKLTDSAACHVKLIHYPQFGNAYRGYSDAMESRSNWRLCLCGRTGCFCNGTPIMASPGGSTIWSAKPATIQ